MSNKLIESTSTSAQEVAPRTKIPTELLDQVLSGYSKPEDLTGPNGLLKQLVAAVVNGAMLGEMSHHLGYETGQAVPEGQSNGRNGYARKTLRSDQGELEVQVPRDRDGTFEPQLVKKHHLDTRRARSGSDRSEESRRARAPCRVALRECLRPIGELGGRR